MCDNNCSNFAHLHVHTQYSLLDGFARINKLVERAAELNMPALAITDHGVLHGAIDFYNACKGAGIKPIIGIESYLAPRTMQDRDPKLDKSPYHLLLLAKDLTGYHNLMKIASVSQTEGFYYRPRVDKNFLAEHSEGVIATSGCIAAQIPQLILSGKEDEARREIGWYQDVFGKDNFFLELQHHAIPELDTINRWLIENAGYANVPLVATNDVHYVTKEEADLQDTLICIQTGAQKWQKDRMRMSDDSYYLTTYAEMFSYFGSIPQAITNTLAIAEMCNLSLDHDGYRLPHFPVPEGYTAESYLREIALEGLRWRYGDHAADPQIRDRFEYEMRVIHEMGFDEYFLIVWDLCAHAYEQDIWYNARGSAAGSIVSYALNITRIEPISNGLLFERFLNPDRVTMPDIDLDFQDDRRSEMVDYAVNRYGDDRVAAIITFNQLGAKAAIRDVGRVHGIDLSLVDKISTLIPQEPTPKPLPDYVETIPELKKLYESNDDAAEIIDEAAQLQGISRNAGVHAAGIVIGDQPLEDIIPLYRMNGKSHEGTALKMATQFPMSTLEAIGLLKVDFLGSATIATVRKACELIEQRYGYRYDLDTIPYVHTGDPDIDCYLDEAYSLLARGETVGVFQVEGDGMRSMLRDMQPYRFEHIVAGLALYRPGPLDFIPLYIKRMHGEEKVEYLHPKLEPILAETFGICVYQEQLMQIAVQLFGYKPGEADLIRKAVGKKKKKELDKHKETFLSNGPEYGVDRETAQKIWEQFEFFANYGFNRSHAAAYAMLTVQTAYLKAHFPAEYMAALMTVHSGDSTKIGNFLADCRRMGFTILPPDINESQVDFSIENAPGDPVVIRFGLGAIKKVGRDPLQHIIAVRESSGKFKSLTDVVDRVDMRRANKSTLESLIKVGAMQSLGSRSQLLEILPTMMGASKSIHSSRSVGQTSLFPTEEIIHGSLAVMKDIPEAPQSVYLQWEKELMGIYVSARPVDAYVRELQQLDTSPIAEILADEIPDESMIRIGGEVVKLDKKITSTKQEEMAILTIEDWRSSGETIKLVIFPRQWQSISKKHDLKQGRVYVFYGKVGVSRGQKQVIGESVVREFVENTL